MVKDYLSQKGLVERVLTIDEIEAMKGRSAPINIMMGQTFDEGQPVDMIKYALAIMELQDRLQESGTEVNSNWLIADHFMVDINQDADAETAREQVKKRMDFLNKLNTTFGGNIRFVLSSELNQTQEYQETLTRLKTEAESNPNFRKAVLEAVPEDRRDNPNAWVYPLEELATIQAMGTDIKVGPVYEMFYDSPAREFAPMVGLKKYSAIHLTKAFPFGNPELSDKLRETIGEFGILPYKIGSKGLGDYRIDVMNDSLPKIKETIRRTLDTRALLDLLVIEEQARQRLERTEDSLFSRVPVDSYIPSDQFAYGEPEIRNTEVRNILKRIAMPAYEEFIHNQLRI
jgi:hypothetical protein